MTAEELEYITILDSMPIKMRRKFLNRSFVGKRLKQEVAIELGITPSHLSSYLAGWRKISDEQKLKLIELLELRRSLSQVAILKEEKSQSASPYFSAIPACLFENEEAKRGDKTG